MIIRTFVSLLAVSINFYILVWFFSLVYFPVHEKGIILITGGMNE